MLINHNATRKKIRHAAANLSARLRPFDTMLVYFSGLGTTAPNGETAEPFLITNDTLDDPATFDRSAVSLRELAAWLKPLSKGKNFAVIFDTSFKGSGGRTHVFKKLTVPEDESYVFEEFQNETGAVVIFAGSPLQVAHEIRAKTAGGQVEMGVFTYYFLRGLGHFQLNSKIEYADTKKDGNITLKEAFDYARQKVYERQEFRGQPQEARMLGDEEKAGFYLKHGTE
jgi:uncharacterized caspase-like protein